MPARDWQCRGQSFLLLVLSKDNVLLQSSLCSNGCGTDDDDDDDDDDDGDGGDDDDNVFDFCFFVL